MLRLDAVSLTYGRESPFPRQALREVSLSLASGERLGICGPSGAGKSSLLLIAAGLQDPSAGRVARAADLRVGLALQEPETALFARTVREELAFAPLRLGLGMPDVESASQKVLADLGLPPAILELDPQRLPAPARRLVALAAILVGAPDLLLLDEPTAGLAGRERTRLVETVLSFQGAVILASHDLDLLWRLCPRLCVLDGGRLVYEGGWTDLLGEPQILTGSGLALPAPLQVLSGLAGRGWLIRDPGWDEAVLARAIVAGAPDSRAVPGSDEG